MGEIHKTGTPIQHAWVFSYLARILDHLGLNSGLFGGGAHNHTFVLTNMNFFQIVDQLQNSGHF